MVLYVIIRQKIKQQYEIFHLKRMNSKEKNCKYVWRLTESRMHVLLLLLLLLLCYKKGITYAGTATFRPGGCVGEGTQDSYHTV